MPLTERDGGSDGEDEALLVGALQQAEHLLALGVVR